MLPGLSLAEKGKLKTFCLKKPPQGVSSHFNSVFVRTSQIVDIRITIMNLNSTEL